MNIVVAKPHELNAAFARNLKGRVAVIGVAFSGLEQFEATTVSFIESLGRRFIAWIDNHPKKTWGDYAGDSDFFLFHPDDSPALTPEITRELAGLVGPVDTVVLYPSFDGVMASLKFALGGVKPYPAADDDALVAVTGQGKLSEYGQKLWDAIRSNPEDLAIYEAIFRLLVDLDNNARVTVDDAAINYLLSQHWSPE